MAKKNFYAVKKGKTPGIYKTWEECKSQIDGFSGAIYKGFSTWEEAEVFCGMGTSGTQVILALEEENNEIENVCPQDVTGEEAVAYVDGSYHVETMEYSAGVVFFYKGEEIRISRKGDNAELASMRNVAGEILGAEIAMREAVARGIKKLTIVHDYQGIASWCLGEWKTNKEGTKAYKEYFDSLQGQIKIQFQKVKGHSGNQWNDLADELAKEALGIR